MCTLTTLNRGNMNVRRASLQKLIIQKVQTSSSKHR